MGEALSIVEQVAAAGRAQIYSQEVRGMPDMSIFRRGVTIHERPGRGGKRAICSAETFLECGTELVNQQGVVEVMLSHVDGQVAALAQNPAFRALERIRLLRLITDDDAARIGKTPFMRLRELLIEDSELTGEGVRSLVAGDLPRQLVRLDLSGNPIGDLGLAALGKVAFPVLERLRLHGCRIAGEGGARFAHSATLPALRELDLGGEYFTVAAAGGNFLGPEGAAALAGASFMGQLEDLRLRGNDIQDPGALALAGVSMPVHHVDLSWNTIGSEGAAALAKAPWPKLRRIGITLGNDLSARSTRRIW